jgi:hypothetical protein
MAGTTVLGDTAPGDVQTDVKFGFIRRIYFNAAIGATGAITVTAADTSGGTTATRTSAGLYALVGMPTVGGKSVLCCGGSIINDDTSPTAADGRNVSWGPISLSAGTASILVTAGDDGTIEDPTSGTTLTAWMDIKCGT